MYEYVLYPIILLYTWNSDMLFARSALNIYIDNFPVVQSSFPASDHKINPTNRKLPGSLWNWKASRGKLRTKILMCEKK